MWFLCVCAGGEGGWERGEEGWERREVVDKKGSIFFLFANENMFLVTGAL